MFTVWLTLLISCVQFSIIAYLMYFFGVLFISLGAASIFFLAFETPFARVEKILVRTCQHISQIWKIDESSVRWVGCWEPLKDPRLNRLKDRPLENHRGLRSWMKLAAFVNWRNKQVNTCDTYVMLNYTRQIKATLILTYKCQGCR